MNTTLLVFSNQQFKTTNQNIWLRVITDEEKQPGLPFEKLKLSNVWLWFGLKKNLNGLNDGYNGCQVNPLID